MPRGSQASQASQAASQRSKGKRARDDDDADYGESFSQQPSQSQSRAVRLSAEEERKGVNRIIKLVLSKDVFKKPVSRSEISSALKGEGVPTSGATVNSLIELAKGKLKHVFGFELADGSKDSLYCGEVQSQMTQVKSGKEKVYFLLNALNTPPGDQDAEAPAADAQDAAVKARVNLIELAASPDQPIDFAFALNVLVMIALSQFKMKESDLIDALRQADVELKQGQTIQDAIKTLKDQMYIEDFKEKDEDDQQQVYYMPGLRAEKEITRARIVNYIEDIFGEQMSEQERNRILPRTDEDDEMQDE
eukprot:Tamp_10794.p1 GENE.Tamp_10794~~Tamp_10794.p1  ORF type:complete len:306 (-),score=118.58 Tamp_10794:791-1708(-)